MTSWSDTLASGAKAILGRALRFEEVAAFEKYLGLLRTWQRTHRLVGSIEPEWVVSRLFLDSLLFSPLLPAHAQKVLDLGAGAGFPGVPLKIVRPEISLTLIEARQRRVSFLRRLVSELRLPAVDIVGERAEAVVESMAGRFDAVVMRCAGTAVEMVDLAVKFVAPSGLVIVAGPPKEVPLPGIEWTVVQSPTGQSRRLGTRRVQPG